jgi:cell division septum initiation protein DivIVA
MKDEIKEILKYLKNNTFIPDETKRKYKILHRDEVNKLLDYIINLQEENERLKKELNALRISEEEWLNETLGGDEE